jgi:hypothetical protein
MLETVSWIMNGISLLEFTSYGTTVNNVANHETFT